MVALPVLVVILSAFAARHSLPSTFRFYRDHMQGVADVDVSVLINDGHIGLSERDELGMRYAILAPVGSAQDERSESSGYLFANSLDGHATGVRLRPAVIKSVPSSAHN